MARATSAYWVAFVKNGDPNGEEPTHWTESSEAPNDLLNFSDSGVVMQTDPWKARLDLWANYWSNVPKP